MRKVVLARLFFFTGLIVLVVLVATLVASATGFLGKFPDHYTAAAVAVGFLLMVIGGVQISEIAESSSSNEWS